MKNLVAALLAATLLSGCQSIFGHHAKLEVRPVGGEENPAAALIALEEGRQHLRAGNLGLAIVALHKAAASPDAAAEAANGLGVAYAMLGRGDLAERYFQQAIERDPAEPKFAANLARYYRSREAALAKLTQPAVAVPVSPSSETQPALAVAEPERTVVAGPGVVQVASVGGAMTRVSDREVTIRTLPEPAAASVASDRRRNPRYVAAAGVARSARYPLRIELAPSGSAR